MTNEKIIKLVNMIIDYENIVMNVLYKQESKVPYEVSQKVHDHMIEDLASYFGGDKVAALDIVDKAVYLDDPDLIKEIEFWL